MTSPSPAAAETLAEMARVDVQTALDEDRDDGETRQQTAARLLSEGVDGRWTPPSGDVNLEPTPEAQAYWAAVRTRLKEIAGTPKTAPEKTAPTQHPAPASDAWSLAWAATAMASIAADLWRESVGSRLVSATRYTEAKTDLDRALAALEPAAPTPPPADGPGLAEAARELADAVVTWPVGPSAMQTPEGERVWRALGGLGRALAAEEEREKLRREAAQLVLRVEERIARFGAAGTWGADERERVARWARAEMETSR